MSAFTAIDPKTEAPFGPEFAEATPAAVSAAAATAASAFERWRHVAARDRAAALRAAADGLDAREGDIVAIVDREAALGAARITGELARTIGQLRAFADLLDAGSYVEATIDRAIPSATPARPELRRMLHPLGPVAVFTPSNFPLAYGVAGGDTASALAAGCSVVVKGHASQPGTSALCAEILRDALSRTTGDPDVLQLLQGRTPETARAVVGAAPIKAVAFTGSVPAGRALFDVASSRPEPIPFYGELGSLNPLFIGPSAVEERAGEIVTGLTASISTGAGQFCTKPGLVFVPEGEAGRAFVAELGKALDATPLGVMLNGNIRHLLANKLQASTLVAGITCATRREWPRDAGYYVPACLVVTDAATFRASNELREEHFGPVAIAVMCDPSEMKDLAATLGGHLTGAIHAGSRDTAWAGDLADRLAEHVGRLIWNGYPTGVTVVPSMQHGGPYPSSTSSLHSAVGTTAIRRFLRPIAYQNWPDALLPQELRAANPLGIERIIDGRRTTASLDAAEQ